MHHGDLNVADLAVDRQSQPPADVPQVPKFEAQAMNDQRRAKRCIDKLRYKPGWFGGLWVLGLHMELQARQIGAIGPRARTQAQTDDPNRTCAS